jgi:uncharacterized protein (TIGR00299 family) protein
MKTAYFDCFSGISGDMCLGALVSAGIDFDLLKEELSRLPVGGYELSWEKVRRNGIAAASVRVKLLEMDQPERRLADIIRIIDSSTLPEVVKAKCRDVFTRLAVAEAAVHGTTPDQIHFHEVGAVDAIVDVVGTVLGLHLLEVDKIYASPLPMGKGLIKCLHGVIPSPAPATLEILLGTPVYGTGIEEELVTPTGAALLVSLADSFTDLPALTIRKVGYGAGKRIMEHPNLLRLILGEDYSAVMPGPVHFRSKRERVQRRYHRSGH